MLAALRVDLKPEEATIIEDGVGRVIHGLFFRLLEQRNPAIGKAIHASSGVKPFTLSTLQGRFDRENGCRVASPHSTYHVRFTTLSEPVYNALSEALLTYQLYETKVSLSEGLWHVLGVSVGDDGAGDAQLSSYQEIWQKAAPHPQATLHWFSPTTFRQGDHHMLFPLPLPTFNGLVRKWRTFSPIPLPDRMLDYIEASVVAEAYQLRTRVVRFGNFQLHGFTGWCRYRCLQGTKKHMKALNALAMFAFYAGTGSKTTMGMGQTRPK